MNELGQLTFRDLDGNVELSTSTSMLEDWYIEVRDIKIADLDVESLARACRQRIFIENIVPFCLEELIRDPLAGEKYDGELLMAVKNLPGDYWNTHPSTKTQLLLIAEQAYQASGDPDLQLDSHLLE